MATETLSEIQLEHAEGGMPQLDVTTYPNMIFWLIIALVALYFILTRFALPRIAAVLAERNDAMANDLEEASLYKRRAEEAEATYNAALKTAREEAGKIAAETKAAINAELAKLMATADAEIGAKSAESERRIREIQDSATESVEQVALETARAIVEAFVPKAADSEAIGAAVANRMKG
jgi:F-type H+-transporting ATPase subunit b